MLWQCLGVLEEGLSFSPSNAQFKLLLLLLFCRLGAFQPVVDLYSSLDAKHVQHDTIGWVYSTNTSPYNTVTILNALILMFSPLSQVSVNSLCRVVGAVCCSLPVL